MGSSGSGASRSRALQPCACVELLVLCSQWQQEADAKVDGTGRSVHEWCRGSGDANAAQSALPLPLLCLSVHFSPSSSCIRGLQPSLVPSLLDSSLFTRLYRRVLVLGPGGPSEEDVPCSLYGKCSPRCIIADPDPVVLNHPAIPRMLVRLQTAPKQQPPPSSPITPPNHHQPLSVLHFSGRHVDVQTWARQLIGLERQRRRRKQ